jgi:putative membrane protein
MMVYHRRNLCTRTSSGEEHDTMKHMMTIAAVGALAISLGACKKNEPAVDANQTMNVGDTNMSGNAMANDSTAMADPTSDAGLASAAATSDMFEIQSSKQALTASKNPAVKGFAQMMVTEHTKSTASLKTAVAGLTPAVTLPTMLSAEQQSMLDGLTGKTGSDFDKAYVAAQRTGHENTLTALKAYTAVAKPGKLKDFATTTTPVVQKHLSMLDKIKA